MGDDFRTESGEHYAKVQKRERLAENRERIVGFLDKNEIKYQEDNNVLTIPWGRQTFIVGLAKGKLRISGNRDWVNWSEKFFK